MNITKLITECEAEIENIKTLPYYTIFNRLAEQEADLQKLEEKLKELKTAALTERHLIKQGSPEQPIVVPDKQITALNKTTILQYNFSNFNLKS
jgi:hypothetical protein